MPAFSSTQTNDGTIISMKRNIKLVLLVFFAQLILVTLIAGKVLKFYFAIEPTWERLQIVMLLQLGLVSITLIIYLIIRLLKK